MQRIISSLYTPKDREKARAYWKSVFSSHQRQLPELSRDCQLSVIIPVYAEHIDRLQKQIDSFALQSFSCKKVECIYVVNNDIPKDTLAWKEAYHLNQKAISFLKKKHPITIHVIDRSSAGKEIPNCNVAQARNIGIAEASVRYFEQDRDGILFQTDADVYLKNKQLFRLIRSDFSRYPLAFGAAGGVIYEFSVDDPQVLQGRDPYLFYRDVVTHFHWQALLYALRHPHPVPPVFPTFFSGAHMVSRAVALACIGGILPLQIAEDVSFGVRLEAFAKHHDGYILPRRESWFVTTALRESTRTGVSFGDVFANLLKEGGVYAADFTSPSFAQFAERKIAEILSVHSLSEVRKIIGDYSSPFLYSDAVIEDMWSTLRSVRKSLAYKAYLSWREKEEHVEHKILGALFAREYPKKKVTLSRLRELQRAVYQDPEKRAYVENVKKHWHNFSFVKKA
jgi:glycosyltransferase involved in cell wall biosynthesis